MEGKGIRCTVYGIRCTVYGIRCMVYGVWCTVYGVREKRKPYTIILKPLCQIIGFSVSLFPKGGLNLAP